MTHRFIARFILEAKTPLFVGSGESSLTKDALVQTDHEGLPMIPGTSLMGVLRHSFEDHLKEPNKNYQSIFGYQNGKEGLGSRVIISNAYLMVNETNVGVELGKINKTVLQHYTNLPVRQHVRITEKGVAEDKGLFDNEVVYAGSRFMFELELKGSKEDHEIWNKMIKKFNSPDFRVGGGTRNGYGNLTVLKSFNQTFDLTTDDFESYLNWNPKFNTEIKFNEQESNHAIAETTTHFQLKLKPDDFFIFGSGYGDEEVDNKPVTEKYAIYGKTGIEFKEKTLIPATSIKGALAHRICFHYNKLNQRWSENYSDKVRHLLLGNNNKAVYELFGAKAGADIKNTEWGTEENTFEITAQRGHVIIDDIYIDKNNDKIFNHVAIDRFTGGAMDGALFSEKVSQTDDEIVIDVFVTKTDFTDVNIIKALELSLFDIVEGRLPLGGMTTKGHGFFKGTLDMDKGKMIQKEETVLNQ